MYGSNGRDAIGHLLYTKSETQQMQHVTSNSERLANFFNEHDVHALRYEQQRAYRASLIHQSKLTPHAPLYSNSNQFKTFSKPQSNNCKIIEESMTTEQNDPLQFRDSIELVRKKQQQSLWEIASSYLKYIVDGSE